MNEHTENKPPIVPLVLWPGASPIYVPRESVDDATALLKGERALLPERGEPDIRRVLDLCPGAGEFSVYCRLRFPVAWVDMVAHSDDQERLCRANAAPGARVFRDEVPSGRYDLVRLSGARFYDPFFIDRDGGELGSVLEARGASILFADGFVLADVPGFALAAQGMRSKGKGFQWWVRSRLP